jgi:hypothetical protein
VDDPFGENVGTVPGTATGSSKRAVTVRDVDATEASLSVTSSARSTRRGPRRLVVSLSVLAVVATAAAALFVVRRYGDPVPALTDVSGVKQAPPTASPPPATRPPADPPILSPDTLPLEQVAQAADAAAAPPPAPEPAVTPPAPARRPPMRRPPRPVRTAAPDTDSRIRLYGQD